MSRTSRLRWLLAASTLTVLIALLMWHFRRPVSTEIVAAQTREVVELVIATGRIRAVRQSEVGAEVPGLLEEVLVFEGDSVTNGMRLAGLRSNDLQRQLERAVDTAREEIARAGITRRDAETNFDRAESLFSRQINSPADLDVARTARDSARGVEQTANARLRESEAAVAVTRQQLPKRVIRAPFNGVILRRLVEPGQSVAVGTTLFIVAEMERVEIYVETDENNLGRLRLGQPATILAPAFPERPFTATLTQIGPNVDTERGVVGLRLRPGPLPEFILPNLTVDVNIEVARFPQAVAVPVSSVVETDGRSSLLIVRDGRLERQSVTVTGRNDRWAAVDGITGGTPVLVHGTSLPPGTRVRAIAPSPARL